MQHPIAFTIRDIIDGSTIVSLPGQWEIRGDKRCSQINLFDAIKRRASTRITLSAK
jgi:hypothetical protein